MKVENTAVNLFNVIQIILNRKILTNDKKGNGRTAESRFLAFIISRVLRLCITYHQILLIIGICHPGMGWAGLLSLLYIRGRARGSTPGWVGE